MSFLIVNTSISCPSTVIVFKETEGRIPPKNFLSLRNVESSLLFFRLGSSFSE